jgi:hypothetical protein
MLSSSPLTCCRKAASPSIVILNIARDLLEGLHRTLAGIALAISQLGKERNVTAKAVERQVAVGATIAVKIGALLAAMERIVGRVQIQHDLGTFASNGFDFTLDEQLLDFVRLRLDLVVTSVDGLCAQLQPIESRLRRQRFALIALFNLCWDYTLWEALTADRERRARLGVKDGDHLPSKTAKKLVIGLIPVCRQLTQFFELGLWQLNKNVKPNIRLTRPGKVASIGAPSRNVAGK